MGQHGTTLQQVVEDQLASFPQDAIALSDAAQVAGDVFASVEIAQHNMLSMQGRTWVDPGEAYAALGPERTRLISRCIQSDPSPSIDRLLVAVLEDTFAGLRRPFLDTPDIPRLVEAAAATAIVCRDRYPELCQSWAEGRNPPSVGDRVVALVHQQLMIDEAWTTRLANGFSWIAYRLEQRVSWSPHYWDQGTWGTVVESKTVVLRDVREAPEKLYAWIAPFSVYAAGSTWWYDEEERTLSLVCRYFFHEQSIEMRGRQHADFSILQLFEAEQMASALADQFSGTVAVAQHPVRGLREAPDDMLSLVDDVVRPMGLEASRFATEQEFDLVTKEIGRQFAVDASPERDLITCAIRVTPNYHALIRLNTQESHPWYGTGLSVATALEMDISGDAVADWLALTRTQLETRNGHGYGSWALVDFGDGLRLTFCRFIPNMSFQFGAVRDTLAGELSRAIWLSDQLGHPENV